MKTLFAFRGFELQAHGAVIKIISGSTANCFKIDTFIKTRLHWLLRDCVQSRENAAIDLIAYLTNYETEFLPRYNFLIDVDVPLAQQCASCK